MDYVQTPYNAGQGRRLGPQNSQNFSNPQNQI